jgi:hypothetical protein
VSQNGNGVVVYQERLPNRISWEEWTQRVHNIGTLKKKIAWYIGDLLNYGLDAFGEKAWQEIEAMGYSEGALSNFKYVAKKFPPEERSSDLPWSTYQAIAPFRKAEREKLITRALNGEIGRTAIRALAASRNDSNGTGAENGSDAAESTADAVAGLPDARGLALQAFVDALAVSGKVAVRFGRGEAINGLLADALDELIAKAMILQAMLKQSV